MKRIITKPVFVGGVQIGADAPISIQSMTNTSTHDVDATLEQISQLKDAGCDIVRIAIPDAKAAQAFANIRKQCAMPLVVDIHFDYKLALMCIDAGADKIRINPGNIGSDEGVKQVAIAAKSTGVPIRIGVNSGSMPKKAMEKYGDLPKAMVGVAMENVQLLNKYDFDDIVISLKASNVAKTIESYKLMSETANYPLHLGVTEAGTTIAGAVKSAMGIGSLLIAGIGDTIRVSLTANPVDEIEVAREILISSGRSSGGVEIISCPTCGRRKIDVISIANELRAQTRHIKKNIKVAIMGCPVNGPGEAREADIGASGGDGCGVIFKKGEIIKTIKEEDIVKCLLSEIEAIL